MSEEGKLDATRRKVRCHKKKRLDVTRRRVRCHKKKSQKPQDEKLDVTGR
jgi:hypothetical protein